MLHSNSNINKLKLKAIASKKDKRAYVPTALSHNLKILIKQK